MEATISNPCKPAAPTPADFDLRSFFPYLVRVYYRAVSESVTQIYESRYGLTVSEWRTMAVLGTDTLSAGEIVERSSMDKVNVSRAIQKLRARGYLRRDIDGDDRRRAVVRLTEDGIAAFADLIPEVTALVESLLTGFSAEERAQLLGLMERVQKNAETITPTKHP